MLSCGKLRRDVDLPVFGLPMIRTMFLFCAIGFSLVQIYVWALPFLGGTKKEELAKIIKVAGNTVERQCA